MFFPTFLQQYLDAGSIFALLLFPDEEEHPAQR